MRGRAVPYVCKKDQALAARRHYDANRPAYIERAKVANKENRRLIKLTILKYLEEHPCIHCGEADPIVLEFDHRIHAEKKFNIGNAANGGKPSRNCWKKSKNVMFFVLTATAEKRITSVDIATKDNDF